MKIIFLLSFLLVSLSSFAQFATVNGEDPKYCGRVSSCHKGYIPAFKSGIYYARGFGESCEVAYGHAKELFLREFGNMECGLLSGPGLDKWACRRMSNQRIVAWVKCNPDSGVKETSKTQRKNCVVGGVWICR